jgi:lysophospholipase
MSMLQRTWKALSLSDKEKNVTAQSIDRRLIPTGMRFSDWAAADGWPLRSFSWPQPGAVRGSLLFLGGRGDFVEKYLEALAHWHDAGWHLDGFDWRGQGGSGRLLSDPLICHQPSLDPLLRDLAGFVDHWCRTVPPPRVIVAHSMGAHLTLRLLATGHRGIDAAVLASPMIDIRVGAVPGRVLGLAARTAALFGLAERKVWGRDIGDIGGRMTSCPDRRDDKAWWKAEKPEIASGPPSWGWVGAACASISKLRPRDLADVDVPVLMLASRRDPIINVRAIERAREHVPGAELMVVDGTGHELLREADAVRLPVLARIDAFLDRRLADRPSVARPTRMEHAAG